MYRKRTEFVIKLKGKELAISIPLILPRNFGYTLVALYVLAQQYGIADSEVSTVLSEFTLLPGRLTILPGISDTVIIDSSYNSNFYATTGLLEVLKDYPGKRKIAVLGDMRELGAESKREHERLAEALIQYVPEHIVLVGPMMKEYVYPRLLENSYTLATVHQFDNTYQAGLFIKERLLKEGDVYLLKASQNTLLFEIIAEMLLVDKNDVNKLCRRETIWEEKRSEIKKSFYKSLHVG